MADSDEYCLACFILGDDVPFYVAMPKDASYASFVAEIGAAKRGFLAHAGMGPSDILIYLIKPAQ